VSLQGSSAGRRRISESAHAEASKHGRLLTGEVAVDVEWRLSERLRWESKASLGTPDVDNILKPLLDGLCGPDGLLIDDCQVQAVSCHWIDWTLEDQQQVTLQVRPLHVDDWITHGELIWIDMGDGLCWPIRGSLSPEIQLKFVEVFERALETRNRLVGAGIPFYDASHAMPLQRRFHRARLEPQGFRVELVQDRKAQLNGGP
jgi:Holliday junction resolvase RusA-like endonuclease